MIPNFNKVFKTEPKAEKKVPKGVIEYLNSTVPKETKYIPGKWHHSDHSQHTSGIQRVS